MEDHIHLAGPGDAPVTTILPYCKACLGHFTWIDEAHERVLITQKWKQSSRDASKLKDASGDVAKHTYQASLVWPTILILAE